MKVYLAHPVSDYRTPRQAKAVALLAAAGHAVENPDAPWHQDGYRQHGMAYFTDLVGTCDGLAFMRFRDGSIGAGVAKEIERALQRRMPVWDATSGRLVANDDFMPDRVLSVEGTRARLKAEARVLVAFSCGDASAVTAKEAIAEYGDRVEVYYCDTFKYEHPDNRRFFADVQEWLGQPITVIRSEKYTDIYDVFERTGWLVGVGGARCTTELKKKVRMAYQRPDDLHCFGFTVEEKVRVDNFGWEHPELATDFILYRKGLTKDDCHHRIMEAGIKLPAMYLLGYKNNNCIGCVKGQSGYWNKIRVDFPDTFARMAKTERQIGAAICKKEGKNPDGTRWRKPVYLDELDPKAGRYKSEADIECGVTCPSKPVELIPSGDPYADDAPTFVNAVQRKYPTEPECPDCGKLQCETNH